MLLKSWGCSWGNLCVSDCLVQRHKSTALYSSSGNTAIYQTSGRFCYSNSKEMQNLQRSMKLFLKGKVQMASGITVCFSELRWRYVELIILIDWLITAVWAIQERTRAAAPNNSVKLLLIMVHFITPCSHNGSAYRINCVFFSLFFSGCPETFSDTVLNSINSPF